MPLPAPVSRCTACSLYATRPPFLPNADDEDKEGDTDTPLSHDMLVPTGQCSSRITGLPWGEGDTLQAMRARESAVCGGRKL